MDKDDRGRLDRPDHDWLQLMVQALLDSSALGDRYALALLTDLIGEQLGYRVSLRDQSTLRFQLLELVRFCAREEGGLTALLSGVLVLEGPGRTADAVTELVRDHMASAVGTPDPPPAFPQAHDGRSADGARDFFVSYTSADRGWATWISWQVEAAGHSVLVQEWDFVPGSNWMVGMERGVTECERTIAVLSPAYLRSVYGRQEWQAVQSADPLGLARKLVPVRVAPCTPSGLLATVVYADLVDQGEEDARKRLLDGIGAAGTGRSRPTRPPRFPG